MGGTWDKTTEGMRAKSSAPAINVLNEQKEGIMQSVVAKFD
jgi:hypothetical protein